MAAIQANIIIGWPSTAGSIPSGWTRETALDGRYIVGAATGADGDLTTDRGFATHTHTSPNHAPIQDYHVHDIEAADGTSTSNSASTGGASTFIATSGHGHPLGSLDPTVPTNQNVAITVDANTSNDLAYTDMIWIKSDGTPTQFPSGAVAFFESDSLPSNWSRFYGNTYLKGATGATGGGTGGSNTHVHTSPAHTHIQDAHTHTGTMELPDLISRRNTTASQSAANSGHIHTVLSTAATATNQPVTTTINSSNHEPPYKKLNAVKSSAATFPNNLVCLWGGTVAALTAQWARVTSMDGMFLKCANADGESTVATGGTTQHLHTASDCQPIQDAHTHSGASTTGITGSTAVAIGGAVNFALIAHDHTWTVYSNTGTNQPAAVTINNCTAGAAYPPYRTLLFVRLDSSFVPPTPTVAISGLTSYDIQQHESIEGKVLPEVAARIARGDRRFYPEAL